MEHLDEVEDAAARDGVGTYQTQMEVVLLSLLDGDRTTALTQIEEARVATLYHAGTLSSAFLSPLERAKSARVALSMLRHSFSRLRTVMEESEDEGPLAPQ